MSDKKLTPEMTIEESILFLSKRLDNIERCNKHTCSLNDINKEVIGNYILAQIQQDIDEQNKFAAFKINYIYEKWMELDQKLKEIG
jgi:hypothetical protein